MLINKYFWILFAYSEKNIKILVSIQKCVVQAVNLNLIKYKNLSVIKKKVIITVAVLKITIAHNFGFSMFLFSLSQTAIKSIFYKFRENSFKSKNSVMLLTVKRETDIIHFSHLQLV